MLLMRMTWRDLYLELYNCFEIWRALRQQYCRCACQISKRCDDSNYQSRGFETSRDLMIRRLIRYWDGPQGTSSHGADLGLGFSTRTQITKSLGSMLVKYRSDAKVSEGLCYLWRNETLFVTDTTICQCPLSSAVLALISHLTLNPFRNVQHILGLILWT